MNVLLVSQCSKQAREQSCRILDQFAERKGDSVWQTAITQQGLDTLRRLLRKTARRNTAVACHWLKKDGQSELLWVVGNLRRFNAQGAVPTNRTTRDILRSRHESPWRSAESIAVLAAVAGLFHDFGKAGALFQQGLKGKAAKRFQPFRHEWLSVRLFQAWVGQQTDAQWLARLGTLTAADEEPMLAGLRQDSRDDTDSPFIGLPPLARVVAWLILSHHRLPQYSGEDAVPEFNEPGWLTRQLDASWNALNHTVPGWRAADFHKTWTFPRGTPLRSATWREKARQLAKRAAHAVSLLEFGSLEQTFTAHLARLTLMLADHFYSSRPMPFAAWQDASYQAWANTDRQTKQLKQKLDEHNVGVAHHALLLGRSLPALREHLPAITRHKKFRERTSIPDFSWQDRAMEAAQGLRVRAQRQGFFGINMASTGCGKTLANARIMYALASEEQGCRFTVAMGLRTLTLQTGDALRTRLGLGEDALAVLIGSVAVRELHTSRQDVDESSASARELFEQHQYVHYDGVENQGPLRHLFESDPKLAKLINAPVLVATIDHLMPATEGTRGGRQIAPMLRLLTSDLVLDEPDDFDIADHFALCRLVNWAGMLGSRVLLSSATLPPALVLALYSAYCSGRKAFQQACGEPGMPLAVCCAWFDECEGKPLTQDFGQPDEFYHAHCAFVQRRAQLLAAKPALRQAEIVAVSPASCGVDEVITAFAGTLRREILNLHSLHRQEQEDGKTVSIGLVRMANINPLVAIARILMQQPAPEGYCIHYCVYHGQHPLAVRSLIEKQLDAALTRSRERPLELHPDIVRAMRQHAAQHHIFVVLGTSVIEVGRDLDADWGIAEPSSMRSLIQLAGRIQRHRQKVPEGNNLLILNKNVRALRGETPAYWKPGFETTHFTLSSHDLSVLLPAEHYRFINARPRILDSHPHPKASRCYDSLIALEHARMWIELLGKEEKSPVAADWWRKAINWSAELQRRTPFRESQPESQFFLRMADEFDPPRFMEREDSAAGWHDPGLFKYCELTLAPGVAAWVNTDYATVLQGLAESRDLELAQVGERYGEITLRTENSHDHDAWLWHPLLGVFKEY